MLRCVVGTAKWGPGQSEIGTPRFEAPLTLSLSSLQRQSGALVPAAGVRHISHRRFLATFPLAAVSRAEQDLYRCVSQAPRGAGVSNFAELIVKGQLADAGERGESRDPHPRGAGPAAGRGLPGGVVVGGGAGRVSLGCDLKVGLCRWQWSNRDEI